MSDRPEAPARPDPEPRASADEVLATLMASLAPLSEELRLRLAEALVEGARDRASLPRLAALSSALVAVAGRLSFRRFLH